MKNLLTVLALMTFGLLCTNDVQAQYYSSAIGARLGSPLSVSYKTFVNETSAVEAYVGFRGYSGYSWVSANVAYQIHNMIGDVDGLSWYYGFGAGLYFYNFDSGFFNDNSSNTAFSVQGYLGLDYAFAEAPINLTVDWIPTYFINGYGSGFGAGYGTLGVRYILGR